jgi:hypothetical protein
MSTFTFNRGAWEDGSPLPEWNDNDDSSSYLQRIGFTTRIAFYGHRDGGHLEIYDSADGRSFYASVCPDGGSCFEVFLPDFPSFMMFIRDHATAFATEASNGSQQEILGLLEKLFQLQHGHAAYDICDKCDPKGWAAYQEHRKKRNAAG